MSEKVCHQNLDEILRAFASQTHLETREKSPEKDAEAVGQKSVRVAFFECFLLKPVAGRGRMSFVFVRLSGRFHAGVARVA